MPAPGAAWPYHRSSPETWMRLPGFTWACLMKAYAAIGTLELGYVIRHSVGGKRAK